MTFGSKQQSIFFFFIKKGAFMKRKSLQVSCTQSAPFLKLLPSHCCIKETLHPLYPEQPVYRLISWRHLMPGLPSPGWGVNIQSSAHVYRAVSHLGKTTIKTHCWSFWPADLHACSSEGFWEACAIASEA